jgi:hypothetical protein
METFPEEFELVGFFESEPEVSERDVPRFYNRHTYRYRRDKDSVVFEIEPASGEIDMTWRTDACEVASFALRRVSGQWVKGAPGEEFITAKFSQEGLSDFILWLKPTVRVQWGNACHT